MDKYATKVKPTWCPGCGAFGVLTALKQAFSQLYLDPDDICLFYDIGCSSNMANFLKTYGFNGLHGRSLPAAVGASLSHHKIPIISIAGDGGAYGEGLNHFIGSCRANFKLTFLVFNNQLYSLTTGQTSPTTFKGRKTKSTPSGVIEESFNPLVTAIVNHCSFVARGFSADVQHLTDLIIKALNHPGFSFIDILSPCVTWNKKDQPLSWYQERVYKLKKDGYPREEALRFGFEEPEKLPIGIFYKENRPSYQKMLPQLSKIPLVKQSIKKINIANLIEEFI
ncbi:MAG TPA: thiamine pyrophosphate-dependent enzyme [Candidatus Bathyarchaeia archaeon]|nr:thiamine pyrophosphate-dependent enzyme [Candidatus Bathyarchaeia archaeon]